MNSINIKGMTQGRKMVVMAIISIILNIVLYLYNLISISVLDLVIVYCLIEIFKKLGEERKHTSVSNYLG